MSLKINYFIFLSILLLLLASNSFSENMRDLRMSTNRPDIDTSIGTLKPNYIITVGQANYSAKPSTLEWAVIKVSDDEGYEISNNIKIFSKNEIKNFKITPTIPKEKNKIKFVQELFSKKWIATSGFFFVNVVDDKTGQYFVFNEAEIVVIGGDDDPLVINGIPFSNCKISILNSKPIKIR